MDPAELRSHVRSYIRDPFLRRLLDAPEPTPETPEEAAARLAAARADLAARIDADIAETEQRATLPRGETRGTIDVPQCMLDAFGLVAMD